MTDSDIPPPGPELGDGHRSRARPLVWAAVSVLTAVLLIALVAVVRSDDDGSVRAVAADQPNASTTAVVREASTTSSTVQPSTTAPRTSTTDVPQTTTTTARIPHCEKGDITVTIAADKTVYASAEEVTITVTATNTSGHDCPDDGAADVAIRDSQGELVFRHVIYSDFPEGARWVAGGRRQDEVTWDQRCGDGPCKGSKAPAGDYAIEANWLCCYGPARTTIRLG